MRSKFSGYWGRPLWWDTSPERKMDLRSTLIKSVFDAFQPEAVFVDHLPGGYEGELLPSLREYRGFTYFIFRGLLDHPERRRFAGEDGAQWASLFHRFLIASDQKIVDVTQEYDVHPSLQEKIQYVGFMCPEKCDIEQVRLANAIGVNQKWVVCSGGGGYRAEEYLEYCMTIAEQFPQVRFDVIFGPFSRKSAQPSKLWSNNLREWSCRPDLPKMHAACDVVISSGGYNTIVEAISGGARIIVDPKQINGNDEQRNNALRWGRHYPVSLSQSKNDLPMEIAQALDAGMRAKSSSIDMNGVANTVRLLFADLALSDKCMESDG